MHNLFKAIKKIYFTFARNRVDMYLFKYFESSKEEINSKETVVVQCVEDYFYYGLFGKVVSDLNLNNNLNIEQIIIRCLSVGTTKNITGILKSFLLYNKLRDNKWIKLYSSFCNNVAFRHEGSTNIVFDIKAFYRAFNIYKNIKRKDDILKLTIDGIDIGDLVYDSYLRYKPAPTVDINNFYLFIVIWQAIRNISLATKYFKYKQPCIFLTTYSAYIQLGISVRVALKYNINVYSFGNEQSISKKLSKHNLYHTATFDYYKSEFFNIKNQKMLLEKSKINLINRFDGKIDNAISYMKESSYKMHSVKVPDLDNHIIIFLHDFYDSIYNYGNLVFTDFLEWIEFTINILKKNNIPFYLKPHPNQIKDSAKVVYNLKIKYPTLKLLSPKITNKQLVESGMSLGVSVYGTVAHELVYMGVPVVLCGENLHSSYSFCHEAKTKEEYTNLIINYRELNLPYDYKEQVESFYYMHNLNKTKEELKLLEIISNFRKISDIKEENKIKYFDNMIGKMGNNKAYNNFIVELRKLL